MIALLLFRLSYTVLAGSTEIVLSPVQYAKALASIVFTEAGILSALREVHVVKAAKPMYSTELGMVIEVRFSHLRKAIASIATTL